jgi:hypothetical protein
MSDEGPEPAKPTFRARLSRASRAEILLVAATSVLFLLAVFVMIRNFSGPPR